MPGQLIDIDPDGLLEYSVVFTNRSLNHMSLSFQSVMNDISATLKDVYQADAVVVVPGGGTYGMEAVARQFGSQQKCLILRNGWFSYRWSQILAMGNIARATKVLKARRIEPGSQAPFQPAPIAEVIEQIRSTRPGVVFAAHVETASGMLLPDDYIKAVAEVVKEVGGLFVLDCIASGTLWVDMRALGVDVLISAPQKGWSASPCAALVMLGERAEKRLSETTSTSFACDLRKWREIMQAYENGAHAYHATLPTDALKQFRDVMVEIRDYGFEKACLEQLELGHKVRGLLESRGFKSVAADGYKAAGVVVSYTDDADLANGSKFSQQGLQVAAGVPLQCDEGDDFRTFRIGLFGIDKLRHIDRSVATLSAALDQIRR